MISKHILPEGREFRPSLLCFYLSPERLGRTKKNHGALVKLTSFRGQATLCSNPELCWSIEFVNSKNTLLNSMVCVLFFLVSMETMISTGENIILSLHEMMCVKSSALCLKKIQDSQNTQIIDTLRHPFLETSSHTYRHKESWEKGKRILKLLMTNDLLIYLIAEICKWLCSYEINRNNPCLFFFWRDLFFF